MSIDFFKQKYGYEIEDAWVPRVTAVTSLLYRNGGTEAPFGFMRRAMDWGTLVHETIQGIMKGEDLEIPEKIAPSVKAFYEWKEENQFVAQDPLNTIEKRVVDAEYAYAGTIDVIGEMNGKRGVVDLKTSLEIADHYALQTAAYLHAYNKGEQQSLFEDVRYDAADTRWIIRIDQYRVCKGCEAKMRDKIGRPVVRGGKASCNHQWSDVKGEIECKEFQNQEKDMSAFLAAKELWEWQNRELLKQVHNYPRQSIFV